MSNISNIIAGAATVNLFGAKTNYELLIKHINHRAAHDGVEFDVAFKAYMGERRLGQYLMTVLCLAAMLLAVIGASHGWSNFVVVPLALTPFALTSLVAALNNRALKIQDSPSPDGQSS